MSYQIQYEPEKNRKFPVRNKKKNNPTAAVVVALILVVCMGIGLRTGWLIPGDPQVTTEAISHMVDMLRQGQPVQDAVTAFCTEVLEHGQQTSG